MGKKKTGRKKSGMKIPNIKISNKALTAIVCVLAVVCLCAGGIYIDTFHGDGMFKKLLSGSEQTEPSAVENEADTQQLTLPISLPLIIGLFIMLHTFEHPESSLSFWASMIPFTFI